MISASGEAVTKGVVTASGEAVTNGVVTASEEAVTNGVVSASGKNVTNGVVSASGEAVTSGVFSVSGEAVTNGVVSASELPDPLTAPNIESTQDKMPITEGHSADKGTSVLRMISETEKILYPKVIRISDLKKKSEGVLASTPPAISDCGEPTESESTRRPLIPVSAPGNPSSQIPAAPALTSTANCTTAMTSAVKDSTTPSGKRWALKMAPPLGTAKVPLKVTLVSAQEGVAVSDQPAIRKRARGRPRKRRGEENEEAASAAPEKMPRMGGHPSNDELCPHCSLGKKSQGCGSGCAWIRIIFPLSFVPVFGSGMGKNQDPGSGINIPDPQHCCRT
jgi:hypothetical protein